MIQWISEHHLTFNCFMITVSIKGFFKVPLHLSTVLVAQAKEGISGKSQTHGTAESRAQMPSSGQPP